MNNLNKFSELILEFTSENKIDDKLTRSKLYQEITEDIANYANKQIKKLNPDLGCGMMRYRVVPKSNVRLAAIIESDKLLEIFQTKLNAKDSRYDVINIDKIGTDINKVKFDFENFDYKSGRGMAFEDMLGPQTLGDLSYIGMQSGGDWEYPVYFIVYMDKNGKTLRGFVPKDGNPWNYDTKQAFGNDDKADLKCLQKLGHCKDKDEYYDIIDSADVLLDKDKIIEEIKNRIQVQKD